MSDETTDLYRALNEQSKEKRANNRQASARLLNEYKIPYLSKNFGAHLVIECADQVIDFWPGTGLWTVRGDPKKRRGVLHLIKHVQRLNPG